MATDMRSACPNTGLALSSNYIQHAHIFQHLHTYTNTRTPHATPHATACQVDSYVRLPANNYSALMNAVVNIGPIAISAAAEPWQSYEGGVFSSDCGTDVVSAALFSIAMVRGHGVVAGCGGVVVMAPGLCALGLCWQRAC